MKLSKCQAKVMSFMCHRWEAQYSYHFGGFVINGRKVCNRRTMEALAKLGLVEKSGNHSWKATKAGLAWRPEHA